MNLVIEEARIGDLNTLVEFQLKMAMETEELQLDREILSKGVKAVYEDPTKARYFVARIDERVVGMLMITLEWSDWRNGWVWWIQSVYVEQEFRKDGVFRSLYSYIRNVVENSDSIKGLRLYVDKRNIKAQKVYDAIGMTREHYTTYEWMKNN
jgi:GNAT superfamily N-acetyltransferase